MRRTLATALVAILVGGLALTVGAGPVAAVGARSHATIDADWGLATFTVFRHGWVTTVKGRVKDTRSDGDCVYVKASVYMDGWTDPDDKSPQNCAGSASGDWMSFVIKLRSGKGFGFDSIRLDVCADDFPPDSCEGRTIDIHPDRARNPQLVDEINHYMTLPMGRFLRAKAREPGPFDWSDNGCSGVSSTPGGFNFLPACKRHDFGYRNYGNGLKASPLDSTRAFVDATFRQDLYDHCSRYGPSEAADCYTFANIYYAGVRIGGGGAFYDN